MGSKERKARHRMNMHKDILHAALSIVREEGHRSLSLRRLRKTFEKFGITGDKISITLICSSTYGGGQSPVIGNSVSLVQLPCHFTKSRYFFLLDQVHFPL